MDEHYEELFDKIDCGFFEGDKFQNEEACKRVEEYMERWKRLIVDIRATLSDDFGGSLTPEERDEMHEIAIQDVFDRPFTNHHIQTPREERDMRNALLKNKNPE
jgi:hypothetical protein